MPVPVAVNLSVGWSAHNSADGTASNWVVAPGGASVTQTSNANPTFFVSDASYLNTTLRTTVRVEDNDNDLFGFALGYKKPASNGNHMDFLLLDWRQSAQVLSGSNGQTFTIRYDADKPLMDVAGGAFGSARTTFDLTGNFTGGGIGFCDHSQPQVRFSNVTLDAQAGIRVPEPGSVALLGLAMCGMLVSRCGAKSSRRDSMQTPSFG